MIGPRSQWRGARRAALPALCAGVLSLSFQGIVVTIASHVGSGSAVGAEGSLARPGYAREPFLALPALSASFVSEALAGLVPPPAVGTALPSGGPGQAPGREPPPEREQLPTETLTASPDIRIAMRVDKAEARPGDTLIYTITISNVGRGDATSLTVSSHIPDYTTYVAGAECGGENVSIDENPNSPAGRTVCASVPGPPAPGEHGFVYGGVKVPAGKSRQVLIRVVVNADAPQGTVLRNHAHATGPGVQRTTSNEVSTQIS